VRATLIDAGPLVALVHRDDQWQEVCVDAARLLDDALVTVWPAFAEAMFLLGRVPDGQDKLWEFTLLHALKFADFGEGDYPRMRELMRKYRDLPMDLADAGLVRVTEREKINRIFTTDRRDFEVYRPYRIGRFRIVP
jgi:predicted nucleic acid-binding protein